ncbi:MAG: hypothetical protein Q9207_008161 [Kuettlingeria erythrocarpa]
MLRLVNHSCFHSHQQLLPHPSTIRIINNSHVNQVTVTTIATVTTQQSQRPANRYIDFITINISNTNHIVTITMPSLIKKLVRMILSACDPESKPEYKPEPKPEPEPTPRPVIVERVRSPRVPSSIYSRPTNEPASIRSARLPSSIYSRPTNDGMSLRSGRVSSPGPVEDEMIFHRRTPDFEDFEASARKIKKIIRDLESIKLEFK